MQIKKLAVAAVASSAVVLSLVTAAPASADYAPTTSDVVGVGSDTVQFAVDFMADGDYSGLPGYNAGARNKLVNFDATPDSGARLAYGSGGLNGLQASGARQCGPGTGGTAGTGNDNLTHTEASGPCTLNPTIALRAGLKPVQRPNGSGGGYKAFVADGATHNIDFTRSSSPQVKGSTAAYDSIQLGTDALAMLVSSTTNAPVGGVTATQLKAIYACTTTDWATVGGTAGTIAPILPQVGSGTRASFLGAIGLTDTTVGSCVTNAEENDPEAIDASGNATNAIEPMSSGRLAMYKGQDATGASLGTGYFLDPSCAYGITTPAKCTTAGNLATPNVNNVLNPNVTYQFGSSYPTSPGSTSSAALTAAGSSTIALSGQTAAIVAGQPVSGTGIPASATVTAVSGTFPNQTITLSAVTTAITPAGTIITAFSTGAFSVTRAMYIYFRDADVSGTTIFQPGGTRNWVRTLFYNPCGGTTPSGATISVAAGNCTGGGLYGPGGAPEIAKAGTQSLISSSGIAPVYAAITGGP
jgi:hypothetical protein